MNKVVTRFAPSPTGYLHIGSARTAMYSYLYAKHFGGEFKLRIEDTDRERYYEDAVEKIYDELKWLGIEWDDLLESQYAKRDRHIELAKKLVEDGKAYYCYTTKEELNEQRKKAQSEGKAFKYDRKWRDKDPSEAPKDINPSIRLKVPLEGKTVIFDEVLGETKVDNKQLDDFIIVRSDGNPIYNLSVVVDDHDMNVTHVIRGSEHLNNTYKQKLIYQALGWEVPKFAHLPVILAPQGQQGKLSKRHGSVTCEDYRNQGYLPEALFNYLLRLGWAHGDKEIILKEEAIELFDFKGVSKSPAHYDNKKLTAINAHYIREGDIKRIFNLTVPFIENLADFKLKDEQKELIYQGFASIKERANTLVDAASMCLFYIKDMAYDMDDKSKKVLNEGLENIKRLLPELEKIEWTHDNINDFFKQKAQELEIKMGKLVQPFRVAVTYSAISPPLFEAMEILGKKNAINRIKLFIS